MGPSCNFILPESAVHFAFMRSELLVGSVGPGLEFCYVCICKILDLTHYVRAPNSRHRMIITPSLRNKAKQALPAGQEKTRAQKHQSMTWAQRLKRVFGIGIETCEQCGGAVKVIASIDKSA
jgi:hypothetical protein